MGEQVEKRFTWVLKNFSDLQGEPTYSRPFVFAGCNWHIIAYPKGYEKCRHLSLFLGIVNPESLPSGWRRELKFRLSLVNKLWRSETKELEGQQWFDTSSAAWGFKEFIPLSTVRYRDNKFLVGDKLVIVAELHVFPLVVVPTLKIIEPLSCNEVGSQVADVSAGKSASQEKVVFDVSLEIPCVDAFKEGLDDDDDDDGASEKGLDVDEEDASEECSDDDVASEENVDGGSSSATEVGSDDGDASEEGSDDDDALEEGSDDDGSEEGQIDDGTREKSHLNQSISLKDGSLTVGNCGMRCNNVASETEVSNVDYDDAPIEDPGDDDVTEKILFLYSFTLFSLLQVESFLPLSKVWWHLMDHNITIIAELDVMPAILLPGEPANIIKEFQTVKETTDVNGFEVLSSQVKSVKRIFERYPDIAVEFNAKNQHLRNACMNFLLSLVETLCQSLEKLSNEDLVEADIALTYLKDAGFKVEWLEKKLDQLKDKKEKEQSCLARLQEIEENLQKLKQKCSELDVLAEDEKAELSATRTALSFDDLLIACRGIMVKNLRKKITWTIKNFSSLRCEELYSDPFVAGGCKWRLNAFPKGNNVGYLFLFLEVADYKSLPSGWRRQARYLLNIVNQSSSKRSRQTDKERWFEENAIGWGFPSMISLDEINAKDSGFLVNGELKIVVEIDLLEIIGKVDVNGFHLLPSQVESVSRIFENHPETASEVHLKNPNLRTGYMNLLLSLIDTLYQSPQQLPKDDLGEAFYALECLTDAGFKLDWLEKKISQVSEIKEKEKNGEIRRQEIEKELKDLKHKCSDVEAQLEKEKSEALAAKTPISFDDIVQ
ncbi:unnamed protein product [Eruca vesicaria subsp. sativa]|uniref:MATH domain-containing protein n=1 Tax=Eruca vesicaria subsp. sativa TaxID=29727 RepID=A0ABC8JVM8_ERUVS|nr:unnamed protein product [Eruca vesicaria subsp. sativa]